MTPKEKAVQLFNKYIFLGNTVNSIGFAKQCALIAVTEIINSNPHSNPFNTDVHSTMQYWVDVKTELTIL
jgi:hypothetical protein